MFHTIPTSDTHDDRAGKGEVVQMKPLFPMLRTALVSSTQVKEYMLKRIIFKKLKSQYNILLLLLMHKQQDGLAEIYIIQFIRQETYKREGLSLIPLVNHCKNQKLEGCKQRIYISDM